MSNDRLLNSAVNPVSFFLTLSIDHMSPATGKGVTPVVNLSKNGGVFAAAAGGVLEVGNGWYTWTPNAADRNTLGDYDLWITCAGCDSLPLKGSIVANDPINGGGGGGTGVLTNADLQAIQNLIAGLLKGH